jgi:Fe2+ or Zn2+ uptake regulation protein
MPIITLGVFDRAIMRLLENKPGWREDTDVQAELKAVGFQEAHLNKVRSALANLHKSGLVRVTERRTNFFLYSLAPGAEHILGGDWAVPSPRPRPPRR